MPDNPTPSGLQYIVLDGNAHDYYPAPVRHAAEVLIAYLAGIDSGQRMTPVDPKVLRVRVSRAAADAAPAGTDVGNLSACGAVYGIPSHGGSGTPAADSSVLHVLVWGPDVLDAVEKMP